VKKLFQGISAIFAVSSIERSLNSLSSDTISGLLYGCNILHDVKKSTGTNKYKNGLLKLIIFFENMII
jgi:hypothetical protein